jgi:hypothetical protein
MDTLRFDPDIEDTADPLTSAIPVSNPLTSTLSLDNKTTADPEEMMDPKLLDRQNTRRAISERLENDPEFKAEYIRKQEHDRVDALLQKLHSVGQSESTPSQPNNTPRAAPKAQTSTVDPDDLFADTDSLADDPPAPSKAGVHISRVDKLVIKIYM